MRENELYLNIEIWRADTNEEEYKKYRDTFTLEKTIYDDDIIAALALFTRSRDNLRRVRLALERMAAKDVAQAEHTQSDSQSSTGCQDLLASTVTEDCDANHPGTAKGEDG